jgi:stage II sporulation protein D
MAFGVLLLAHALAVAQEIRTRDVRIRVLGLFHTQQFTVSAAGSSAVVIHECGETSVLETSSRNQIAEVRAHDTSRAVQVGSHLVQCSKLTVTDRTNGPADFRLAVPGKITRHYLGTLELTAVSGALVAVVTLDLETAVASVVAAESLPDAPLESMKAQAIATRSYFVAGKGRHLEFDFCDTTHCQFLREPPAPGSAAEAASMATRGLVLVYQSQPFAAMYTRSCGGQTRTPADVGLSSGVYPYYSVNCKYCHQHPSHWQSKMSVADAATLRSFDEASRLKIDRRLGWSTAPSNDFIKRIEGDEVVLEGTGQGHGIGLCQAGARAMAEEGADFQQILGHYYPNTTIVSLDHPASKR